MGRSELLELLLDSLKHHFIFVDTAHVIQYMNKAAVEWSKGKPAKVGMSIFTCHKEESKQIILDVVEAFQEGEDEKGDFRGRPGTGWRNCSRKTCRGWENIQHPALQS